ncbi:MAG: hypothetical protein GF334_02580 [Candidatus Altiarchaeales archaeon]|nr:hypothetical protein [Candidatus Altiarchaeales archaeon]
MDKKIERLIREIEGAGEGWREAAWIFFRLQERNPWLVFPKAPEHIESEFTSLYMKYLEDWIQRDIDRAMLEAIDNSMKEIIEGPK